MYQIVMPHIKRKWGNKYLYVPGGWKAQVPRIEVESCVMEAWVVYLRQSGMGVMDSIQGAKQIGQSIYLAGYRPGLISHTAYWAKQYAKMFPDSLRYVGLVKRIYSLDGFDPEIIQTSYIPFHHHGKRGQPFMNKLLVEMHDEIG